MSIFPSIHVSSFMKKYEELVKCDRHTDGLTDRQTHRMAALLTADQSLQMQLNKQKALSAAIVINMKRLAGNRQKAINQKELSSSPMFARMNGMIQHYRQVLNKRTQHLQKALQALSHTIRRQGNIARTVKTGLKNVFISIERKMDANLKRLLTRQKLSRTQLMEMRTMRGLSKSLQSLKTENERSQHKANHRLQQGLRRMMIRTVKKLFKQEERARQDDISQKIHVGLHIFARTMKNKLNNAVQNVLRKLKSRLPSRDIQELNNQLNKVKNVVNKVYKQLRKSQLMEQTTISQLSKPLMSLKIQNRMSKRKSNKNFRTLLQIIAKQGYLSKDIKARVRNIVKKMQRELQKALRRIMRKLIVLDQMRRRSGKKKHGRKLDRNLQKVRNDVHRLFNELKKKDHRKTKKLNKAIQQVNNAVGKIFMQLKTVDGLAWG
ncbi:hypothetical protein DPMN_090486 [Dreissena polymorpha]|uniref:Uncharacterized protein n=1 Tax=Dreissena polymorpha TaxID=45954 RepID=A0A9D4KY66_DREPO|nr:hypothetical protein DPMN_090486 [Dreissena polymorpha]